jgi:hypothetical protein
MKDKDRIQGTKSIIEERGEKIPSTEDRDETIRKRGPVTIITEVECGTFVYYQTLHFGYEANSIFFITTHKVDYYFIKVNYVGRKEKWKHFQI